MSQIQLPRGTHCFFQQNKLTMIKLESNPNSLRGMFGITAPKPVFEHDMDKSSISVPSMTCVPSQIVPKQILNSLKGLALVLDL